MYTRRGSNTIQCVSIAAQVSWLLNILHSVEAWLDSVRGQRTGPSASRLAFTVNPFITYTRKAKLITVLS